MIDGSLILSQYLNMIFHLCTYFLERICALVHLMNIMSRKTIRPEFDSRDMTLLEVLTLSLGFPVSKSFTSNYNWGFVA